MTRIMLLTALLALLPTLVEARPPPRPLYPEPVIVRPKPPVYVWACKIGYTPACRLVR